MIVIQSVSQGGHLNAKQLDFVSNLSISICVKLTSTSMGTNRLS